MSTKVSPGQTAAGVSVQAASAPHAAMPAQPAQALADAPRAPVESLPASGLVLWRGADGQLWGRSHAKAEPRSVRVCRLFPWSQPAEYVSLRDADEEELALVRQPSQLDRDSRAALELSLAEAGFVMEIEALLAVDDEIEIRTFEVETAQGPRRFQTERDEWPRELAGGGLLFRDVAGDLYAVRHPERLDDTSRKLLWAFLD
jgi:hypothetical protein